MCMMFVDESPAMPLTIFWPYFDQDIKEERQV